MAKIIMVQGTMSNAGKSLVTAGLCRVFMQDGYRVAPFKSQNMALNSYITDDGYEMGRAQVMQAEACGIKPDVRMNPILLKPTGDVGSQVIVNGEVFGNMKASEYFRRKTEFIPQVKSALASLAEEYDIIVIEGAGSPAEINLKSQDIVNMGMARMANSPVLLVGDIDRGGVFASLYGTVALLEQDERDMIKGLIINKFRGDPEILRPGLVQLEELVDKPVLGVVPYLQVDIDDEDSLSERFDKRDCIRLIDVAVIRLPRISNFTDFNSLERNEFVSVRYVTSTAELGNPDLIILPGTKNTMSDLLWLRQCGLEALIKKQVSAGTPLVGICGGYQMLGKKLSDPDNVEAGGEMLGLGLLDCETVFESSKVRTRVDGNVGSVAGFFEGLSGSTFTGYEIHMGRTSGTAPQLATLSTDVIDGAVNDNVMGSYVHGIFDEGNLYDRLVAILLGKKGISAEHAENLSHEDYKNREYDKLALGIRNNVDMKKIYEILEAGL